MGKQRDPKRDEAFEIYKASGGEINLNVIAAQLGVGDGTLRGWKAKDKWDKPLDGDETKAVESKPKAKKANGTERNAPINGTERKNKERSNNTERNESKNRAPSKDRGALYTEIENDELTDKQKLFCLYYVKSFNATFSAIKAGYAKDHAHTEGSRLLRNVKVGDEIRRLKGIVTHAIFADVMDVFNKYAAIAFADITDYVEFGQKDEIMMTEEGPVIDPETGKHMTYKRSFVAFKNSDEVDGTLISEVKQGKDGVSVKLIDKMKALEKLEIYFDLLPDHHKRMLEDEKLKIMQEKHAIEKGKVSEEDESKDDWITAFEEVAKRRKLKVEANEH